MSSSDEWDDDDDRSTSLARAPRSDRESLTLVLPDGAQVSLDRTLTLGSAKEADVRIVGPTVSRLHARIEWTDRGTHVVDLLSTNGTFVDGVRVSGAELRPGARLELGEATLRIDPRAGRATVELWPEDAYGPLFGRSASMRALFSRIDRAAKTASTVLITGETGTGKEMVARAIHEASPRRARPFVVVDCGAIPEPLFESELFGHVRGAFTGADRNKDGAVPSADGGTLFLDEVGELPPSVQPKLLRMLEARTFRRVGETAQHPADVRVVAATHRDLAKRVAQGAFREDLWFRLAVLTLEVPPLRERPEDIPALAARLAGPATLDPTWIERLRELPWLGNVRELRNFVERAAAFGTDDVMAARPTAKAATEGTLDLSKLPIDRPYRDVKDELLEALERRYLEGLLERTRWNVSAVAEAMGMNRSHVHRLLNKHGLSR